VGQIEGPSVTVAWVESPFQLLGSLESHSAGQLTERLVVLPREGSEPLRRTIAELRRLGLPAGVCILEPVRAPRRQHGNLAVGDAFSGQVHLLLLLSRPRSVVLLDDGRSTRRVMDALVGTDLPLVRPHITPTPLRAFLARLALRRLRHLASRGRLRVVTAMDLPAPVLAAAARAGILVSRHDFSWLRGLPGDLVADADTVVLGTSMVATKLIAARPYLDWIASIASQTPITYRAHRREDVTTLGPLAQCPGVTIKLGEVPVEVSLRGLTPRQRLLTLPTTAVSTLRLVAPSARIQEFAVPEAWWLPEVPIAARQHLVPDGPALSPLDVPATSPDPAPS
jgi:hypothetical protein